MNTAPLMPTIATHRAWHRRLTDLARERLAALRQRTSSLRELDARSLADIGVHASEIASIEAEAHGPSSGVTRRRIVAATAGV
jgi:uncharacterized protein YjiS (DUF1127 family)